MEFKTENILSYYSYPFKVSMEGCKFQTTMFSLNTLLIDLAGYVPYVPLYWNGNGKWTWPSHRSLWLRCIIMSSASLMLFMNVQFSATIVLLTTQNGHCIYKQLKELIDMYMLANGILLDTFRRSITVFLDISFPMYKQLQQLLSSWSCWYAREFGTPLKLVWHFLYFLLSFMFLKMCLTTGNEKNNSKQLLDRSSRSQFD